MFLHSARRRQKQGGTKRASFSLQVETLEDRLVPAGLSPTYIIDHPSHNVQAAPDVFDSAYGYTPAQIRTAYNVSKIAFGATAGTGAGQTIAIVDAYNDPNIVNDVDTFDKQFGSNSDTSGATIYQQYGAAASFLTVYNENGQVINPANTTVPVDSSGGWEGEESLDVEWAHAMAPGAKIDLVACNSSNGDLYTGVRTAAGLPGVSVVSMSWSGTDQAGEASLDALFTTPAGHQGVTFLASTGDYSVAGYPAYSPNVIAVGGTTLTLTSANSIQSEAGWSTSFDGSGTGGGISQFEKEPAYQDGVQHTGFRSAPDVAFVADPSTGVAIYDTYDYSGWMQVGGTSLSCPSWAGIMALANQGRSLQGKATFNSSANPQQALTALYQLPSGDFHDITSGDITTSAGQVYLAGPGYDEVTGLGTPVANNLVGDLVAYGGGSTTSSATQLGFTTEPPASVNVGSAFGTVVQLENASSGAVAQAGVTITLTLSSGKFSTGSTTVAVASNASGQAVFSNLIVSTAGTYTLTASAPGLSGASSTSIAVGTTSTTDWFSQHISDLTLQSLARTDYNRDHGLTFTDMLGLLAAAAKEGSVASNTLQSLQTLVANAGYLNMPGYVSNLAGKVVDGDPANATYQYLNSQGNVVTVSLGNLKTGSSATPLTELTGKWFLGTDEPTAGAAYSVVSGTAFGSGGPVYTDVYQGGLGDCTVMASLAETAARDNSAIANMFTLDGTNTVNGVTVSVYTVRFFDNGTPTYVTVDTELPAGGGLYDHPHNGVLWVALAEKAYAELNHCGWLGTLSPGADSYAALNTGNQNTMMAALSAFTGLSASAYSFNATTVAAAMQAGKLVVLGTGNTVSSSSIVNNHCYAVVGYNASSSQPFQVFNPWGINGGTENGQSKWGQFTTNGAFLAANFIVAAQTGTALPRSSGLQTDHVQEPMGLYAMPDGRGAATVLASAVRTATPPTDMTRLLDQLFGQDDDFALWGF